MDSSALGNLFRAPDIASKGSGGLCRRIAAQDAEEAGSRPYLKQGLVKPRRFFGLHVQKELVFPGAAMNRPAFDFQKIDAVVRKGPQRGQQRSRLVGEPQRERKFV